MKAEFIFDTVCPWCYLGKVRLVRALRMRPEYRVALRWTPFTLNPDLPLNGADRQSYLERKLGGAGRVQRLNNAVVEAARDEGVKINFERLYRMPNSLHSQRFIKLAAEYGLAVPAIDLVFKAYFKEGIDIGQIEELIELGLELGISEMELAHYLYSDTDFSTVVNENARARRLGVTGVPCIIFNDRFAISGAQETAVLLSLLDLAAENHMEPVSG